MAGTTSDTNSPLTLDPSPALVGIELGGDLRVVERLNAGSFSTVYRAECTSTNTNYALKFIRKAAPGMREFKYQCMELEAHLRVHDHPGIVTLHRVLEHGEYMVLVLDHIKGGDLLDAFANDPARYKGDERRVRDTFGQMLYALKHTHNSGVSHRDLKLENFLVTEDLSTVYLADFGLATTSRVYEAVGSMPYVPPEHMREHVHPGPNLEPTACDVWAMGCLLYQLLTGVSPWNSATVKDENYVAFMQHRRSIFTAHGWNICPEAQALIIRALAPHPVDRINIDDFVIAYDLLPSLYIAGNTVITRRKRAPNALRLRCDPTVSTSYTGQLDRSDSSSSSSSSPATPVIGRAPAMPLTPEGESKPIPEYLPMPGVFYEEELARAQT